MKLLITLLVIFISYTSFANNKDPSPAIVGTASQSYYLEIVPKQTKTLIFKTKKSTFLCEDKLQITPFESTESLPSTETPEFQKVKIINLHVNKLLTACMKKGSGKQLKASFETPKLDQMTHVYITTDNDIDFAVAK
jgi:hypothetical protein